jgi:hypothetical protein
VTAVGLSEIESMPRTARDPTMKDVRHTVAEYLKEKAEVCVYSWPERGRSGSTGVSCVPGDVEESEDDGEFDD